MPKMKDVTKLLLQSLLAAGSVAASNGRSADLWNTDALSNYEIPCKAKSVVYGELYTLNDLYPTLQTWAWKLKVFFHNQEYPGPWEDEEDPHGLQRQLVKMDWYELPAAVRRWINTHPDQRKFAVYGDLEGKVTGDILDHSPKTVFFAPGAIYPILPLFVDDGDKECEGVFSDLDNFTSETKDGAVHAKLVKHEKDEGRENFGLQFVVETRKLRKKPEPKETEQATSSSSSSSASATEVSESTAEEESKTKDEL